MEAERAAHLWLCWVGFHSQVHLFIRWTSLRLIPQGTPLISDGRGFSPLCQQRGRRARLAQTSPAVLVCHLQSGVSSYTNIYCCFPPLRLYILYSLFLISSINKFDLFICFSPYLLEAVLVKNNHSDELKWGWWRGFNLHRGGTTRPAWERQRGCPSCLSPTLVVGFFPEPGTP